MNYQQAYKLACGKAKELNHAPIRDTRRQQRKFANGVGIVRQYAELPHGVVVKDVPPSR